ncbi:MAG: choice-of-anchor D domain-containing protein, partial [Planctomycetes bacterium]|nr:choice-of-anchor D domain-containing protein [Planctomycetota bacterium]
MQALEDRRVLSLAPVGPSFAVDGANENDQLWPSAAINANGESVVAYAVFGEDLAGFGVYAVRYNAAGAPQGAAFRVNTHTLGDQTTPSVAMNAAGEFVVAWSGIGADYNVNGSGVYARRYDAAGIPQGSEFRASPPGGGKDPSIAMNDAGELVIAWSASDFSGVYAQRYDAAGLPQGDVFQVNTFTGDQQAYPTVAIDADGDFVAAWTSTNQDGSEWGVYARRYNVAGVPQGDEFRVNTFTSDDQWGPSAAMDADGGFLIAWTSIGQDGSQSGVYAQRYNAAGVPQGDEFRVNTFTSGTQQQPSVAMDAEGNAIIAWHSTQGGSDLGIYAQAYDASGAPDGGEVLVNNTSLNQYAPHVAMNAQGSGLMVWHSNRQPAGQFTAEGNPAIHARRYFLDSGSIAPEVQVTQNGVDVPDGSHVSFSTVVLNQPDAEKTFTITNTGTHPLTLSLPVTVTGSAVFSAFPQPALSTLFPGQSTTFHVNMDAAPPGFHTATISFGNNDADESPFDFTVSGTVLFKQIVDDATENSPEFSRSGNWGDAVGFGGHGNDFRYALDTTGNDVATWTTTVPPGVYRISGGWLRNPYWATNASFTILDGAVPRGTASVDQRTESLPGDFIEFGLPWRDIGGLYNITSGMLTVLLDAKGANGYVVADAIRILQVGDLPAAAEIEVAQELTYVADETGSVSFGTAEFNVPIEKTFTISNTGQQTLEISGGSFVVPAGYALVSPPALTVNPGETTSFVVRLDAHTPGTYLGEISFVSNDPDEGTFNFSVTGTVLPTRILDDGEAGYSHTGDFQSTPLSIARDGDNSYALFDWSPSEAVWTFTVTPGQYRVAATWFNTDGSTFYATNAPFTVLDGATPLGTFQLNQRQGPDDFIADGSSWENIGGVFNVTGSTLTVRLTNVGADGYVLADAVRLEWVGPPDGFAPSAVAAAMAAPVPVGRASRLSEMATVYSPELEEVVAVVAEDIAARDDDDSTDDGP